MTDELDPNITLIPAATLILLRPGAGAPEVLMIERGGGLAFAAGALVFPGGRIDPGDWALALDPELTIGDVVGDEVEVAARIAAIRETIEEVGIAVGLVPQPDALATASLRAALAEGADFAALLASTGYRLDLSVLTAFAWWRPQHLHIRNFDTRFFLAEAPVDALGEADGGEAVHALWGAAADILAQTAAGRGRVIFPTKCNLQRLALFGSLEEARADAASRTIRPIGARVEQRDGTPLIVLPDDQGYPVTVHDPAELQRT